LMQTKCKNKKDEMFRLEVQVIPFLNQFESALSNPFSFDHCSTNSTNSFMNFPPIILINRNQPHRQWFHSNPYNGKSFLVYLHDHNVINRSSFDLLFCTSDIRLFEYL